MKLRMPHTDPDLTQCAPSDDARQSSATCSAEPRPCGRSCTTVGVAVAIGGTAPAVKAESVTCLDTERRRGLRLPRHGGHTRSTTRPTTESTGTGPNDRESTEPKRWSPRRKTVPAGTLIGPK